MAVLRVQAVANDTGLGAGSFTLTLPATSTAGNTIIVAVNVFNGSTITQVKDDKSQTYTQDVSTIPTGGLSSDHLYFFSFPNTVGGAQVITVTLSGSQVAVGFALEYSGLLTTNSFDKTAAAGNVASPWSSGNTATTSQANELLLGYASAVATADVTMAPSGSWAFITGTNITNGHHGDTADGDDAFMEEQIVSSTGAYAATGTSTAVVDCIIATYKAAAGGGGSTFKPRGLTLMGVGQ